MPYRISLTERNAAVNGLTGLFNKGGNPSNSTINIYGSSSQPATPETAVPSSGVLLVKIPFSSSAFANSVGGTGIANALPLQATIINSGTAEWFRFFTGESTPSSLGDGSITISGSGGDMTFNSIDFISGGTVSISNLSISIPM